MISWDSTGALEAVEQVAHRTEIVLRDFHRFVIQSNSHCLVLSNDSQNERRLTEGTVRRFALQDGAIVRFGSLREQSRASQVKLRSEGFTSCAATFIVIRSKAIWLLYSTVTSPMSASWLSDMSWSLRSLNLSNTVLRASI